VTFGESFRELLVPLLVMNDAPAEAEEVDGSGYFDTFDQVETLLDGLQGFPDNAGALLTTLETLSSPEVGHCQYFSSEYFSRLRNVVALAKNISIDVWELEAENENGFHLHVLEPQNTVGKIRDMQGDRKSAYYFNDPNNPGQSLAFLDFRENIELSSTGWGAEGEDVIQAHTALLLLGSLDNIEGVAVLVSSSRILQNAIAQVKYHFVLDGLNWSKPVELPASVKTPLREIRKSVGNPKSFKQFTEPFSMLSEVNACQGILETFLSTYHVLENYMIRKVVAKSTRTGAGREFQRVRDFKRLGKETDQAEASHLEGLFKACWNIEIDGANLSETLSSCFTELQSFDCFTPNMFDDLLRLLALKTRNGTPLKITDHFETVENQTKYFPALVYSIRCAIVHNKATEFHISNEELIGNQLWQKVIGNYCLPVMLRLAFGIPSITGCENPIRYQRKALNLY